MTASPVQPAYEEEIERIIRAWQMTPGFDGWDAKVAAFVASLSALFAPILAEKERELAIANESRDAWAKSWDAKQARALAAEAAQEKAELVLCDLMNTAGHYRSTLSEDDRDALSSTINRAVEYFEAAAIRAQGE